MEPLHILFVDDEEAILRAIRRDLRGENFVVHSTPSPEEALKILEREKISIIVSDHRMPKMTGLELLTVAKERFPEVIRVILTGQADMPMVIKAINLGQVYQFMTKPWEPQELKETLRRLAKHVETVQRLKDESKTAGVSPEVMSTLEQSHPGISSIRRGLGGAIEIDLEDTNTDLLAMLRPVAEQMS